MIYQRAFTLIETLIFIIVLGVGLAGIAQLFTTNIQHSSAPLIRERTHTIASALMEEIISKRFNENTPIGGGCLDSDADPAITTDSCTQYCSTLSDAQCLRSKCQLAGPSDCRASAFLSAAFGPDTGEINRSLWDDIDDFNGDNASPPQDITGNPVTDYSGYTTSVSVTQPATDWNGIPAADVRRISVTVTNPLNESLTLISYRVNL